MQGADEYFTSADTGTCPSSEREVGVGVGVEGGGRGEEEESIPWTGSGNFTSIQPQNRKWEGVLWWI